MRKSSSVVNVKGTVSRKKPLSVLSRHCACRNGVYVFGLVALLWLSWRVVGKSGDQQLASGQASFLHGAAHLVQAEKVVHHGAGGRAMFAGSSALHAPEALDFAHELPGGVRARAAIVEAAAAPVKGKSLGFYWGIRADAAGAEGAASLPPGVSIQHLQKVAGETRSQGKLSSGFYFSQDIPAKLKADADSEAAVGSLAERQQMHRKELKTPKHSMNPLGFYFQEEAHKGGLTGGSSAQLEGAAPEDKPLKYYFTKDIPDDAKRQLAFKAMMKAQMDGVGQHAHRPLNDEGLQNATQPHQ